MLEQQFAKRGDALRGMNFDQIDGQTKDQMVKGLLELNTDLQVMALPLWAGWFSSLVLLGGAAGMLATSMRVLRQQLEEEYHVAEEMQAMEEKRIAGVKEKFDGAVQAVAESSSSPLPIEYTTDRDERIRYDVDSVRRIDGRCCYDLVWYATSSSSSLIGKLPQPE